MIDRSKRKWLSFDIPEKEKILNEQDELKQALMQVKFINQRIGKNLKELDQKHYMIVHYEDLVRKPEQILGKIGKNLNIQRRPEKINTTKTPAISNQNKKKLSQEEWTQLEKLYQALYNS